MVRNISCRIMRQLIFPVAKKAKRLGGKRHVLIQATLSTKLNGRTEWTVADAAVLFKEPVEDLVSDFAIEAISGGLEYQLNQNGSVDISRRELSAPAGSRVSVPPTSKCPKTSKIKPSPKMGPDFFIVWVDQGRSGISDARFPRIRYFPLWCGSYRFIRHGHAPPGSMSGSLKTILRGSTSRVNLPNAQSNDCGRSPTNDGNGNAASCDLSSGSLNAPPRLWQLPYTKLSPWMAPQWGQTPARYSHPIDFEYFGRTPQFMSSKRRNAWDNSPALSTPLQETIRQRYPSRPASSRNRPVCMVLYPHFQQGTGLTLRIKATLLSVHTSGALSVLVTSHAIDSPAYTGRISMPMIRFPSSMDLSRTILSPPYHSPAQRRFGISTGT